MKKYTSWPGVIAYDPADTENFKRVKREVNGKEMEIIFRKGKPGITVEQANEMRAQGKQVPHFAICPNLNPRTYCATDVAPHIICEQDLSMRLRDGTRIYFDLYRAESQLNEPLPLIICWGPFGKRPAEGQDGWKLMGVPPQTVSIMSKFEAADPGYWCRHGYAVANVDPRGIGHSEGDTVPWGIEDGKDGYDFIEWAGEQSWCNGRCTLFGNSGVCMVIWRIAAQQPSHLACIAAWEGTGDMYRESLTYNGIPRPGNEGRIIDSLATTNFVEDLANMMFEHPFYDDYWKTKTPQWENIRVPAYVCAGLSHFHLRGSTEGWRRIRSPKKWFRAHRDMEWPDTYNPDNMADLLKFYDRYMKDERNGWEFTPKVRIDIMDAYGYDFERNHVEDEFPIKRTQYTKLYLNAEDSSLNYEKPEKEAEAVYDNFVGGPIDETTHPDYIVKSNDYDHEIDFGKGGVDFNITFNEDTILCGYIKLHLWIECRGYDNMDIFARVRKYGVDGTYLPTHCMGEDFVGAWGQVRGTRRELDPKLSTDYAPVQAHQKEELMEPGQIYPIDFMILPHSRIWHKGETLNLHITPEFMMNTWFEEVRMYFEEDNGEPGTAKHVIHTGGQYDSYLQIPIVPPKYKAGDYVYLK